MAIDFTSWTTYAYPAIAVGTIVIIVYGVKLFLLKRNKKPEASAPSGTSLPSEKELKLMLKNLEEDKKKQQLEVKEQEKLKKAELKVVANKKTKKEKEVAPDTHQIEFQLHKTYPRLSWDRFKSWYLEKYHPGKIVLIHMELTNGFHKLFKVKEREDGFIFRGKKYVFDDDSKYYNIDTKLYTFDYHEQIALPFKRKIPVTQIKKAIETTEGIDIEYAINPSTLQRFMTAKIAEGVMKGTQLDEFMKKLQMFLIVTMIAVLVHLALFLYGSGILQNISVPGIG